MRARPLPRLLLLSAALLAILPGGPAAAVEDAEPSALAGPSAREIYDRLLGNRFDAYEQQTRLVSGDRAGNEQESRMTVLWKSFRDEQGEPRKGALSKTRIRYTHPFDLRFSGYLVINNRDRADDQFVYLATRRRVRRVNLRGEPVLGSDFSFEDVIPRELEDADYRRLPDERVDGRDCYVVEVTPKDGADSEYSRFRSWIDRERWVALQTQYWDTAGVQVKDLRAPAAEVKEVDGVWVPMRTEMRSLQTGGYTVLQIDEITGNLPVDDNEFDPRKLESH